MNKSSSLAPFILNSFCRHRYSYLANEAGRKDENIFVSTCRTLAASRYSSTPRSFCFGGTSSTGTPTPRGRGLFRRCRRSTWTTPFCSEDALYWQCQVNIYDVTMRNGQVSTIRYQSSLKNSLGPNSLIMS